jgi:hypothetical protein
MTITTASSVAKELRRLADALDKGGEAPMVRCYINFLHYKGDKNAFLSVARFLPRPLKKEYSHDSIILDIDTPSLSVRAEAPRTVACRVITPAQEAVYECEPLLADGEDAALLSDSPEAA